LPSARAAALGAVASATAALTAVALSPLTPVGVARKAEVRPGLELNAAHVGVGVASIAFIVVALGVLTSWRSATAGALADADEVTHGSPSRVANALARPRLPVSATVGVRMAVQPGRGRATVPVRSTLVGASIGVATIVAVITFAASLGHLFDEPRLYGWNWDLQIGDQFAPDLTSTAADLRRHPDVTRVTSGTQARLTVGSLAVDALALDQPGIEPVVVAGRPARAADEILLGTRTLRALGLDIGDRVPVAFGDRSATMRVVGRGVLPEFAGSARLGEGAVLTFAGIERLVPEAERDVMLLRLRPDTDVGAFLDETGVVTEQVNPYLPDKPSDLADLERVGGLPSVVVGLLALMAAATVAHTLTTSVRRRRRDLAILKVLGLGRRQVSAVVAWQSTVIAVVAVVAGVPLGAAAGRWAWRLFADQLGVPPEAVTPLAAVLLLVPGTILLANLVGAVPAWLAGRTRPAVVLRTG
jgi:ABC-type lipoprotein release transport system permease subunit